MTPLDIWVAAYLVALLRGQNNEDAAQVADRAKDHYMEEIETDE